jgi:hypothetical protein
MCTTQLCISGFVIVFCGHVTYLEAGIGIARAAPVQEDLHTFFEVVDIQGQVLYEVRGVIGHPHTLCE